MSEYVVNLPYPHDVTDTASVKEYLCKLRASLQDDSAMGLSKKLKWLNLINKPFVDVRDYSSFSLAIDGISTSSKTLVISSEQAVTASKTVPSNVTLMFMQGGSLAISDTKTVTINGHVEAGLYQIFSGAGTVTFGAGAVKEVYPEWWGIDGTADNVEITKAIASLPSTGGVLKAPNKTYAIAATVDINKSNVTLDFGTAIFSTSAAIDVFSNVGSVGVSSLLTVNGVAGDLTVTIASATGFSVGDYILIRSENVSMGVANMKDGEIHQILSITGNVITLLGELWDSYSTANTGTVQLANMRTNFKIIGGRIVGADFDTTVTEAVFLQYVAGFEIDGLGIENCADQGINLYSCVDGNITNCHFSGIALAGAGYSISNYFCCQNINIEHNYFRNGRHFISGNGASGYGMSRFININQNHMEHSTSAAVDCHELGDYWTVDNNTILGNVEKGIKLGCRHWKARGNRILGDTAGAFQDRGNYVEEIILENNIVHSSYYGVFLESTALIKVIISGFKVSPPLASYGIYINPHATCEIHISDVDLCDNDDSPLIRIAAGRKFSLFNSMIRGANKEGVLVAQIESGEIIGNNVSNCSQESADTYAGLALVDCLNFAVAGNSCYDDQGVSATQGWGIKEVDTSDWNLIHGNRAYGNTVAEIVTAGANTVSTDNL